MRMRLDIDMRKTLLWIIINNVEMGGDGVDSRATRIRVGLAIQLVIQIQDTF